jgi:hypothetical protein
MIKFLLTLALIFQSGVLFGNQPENHDFTLKAELKYTTDTPTLINDVKLKPVKAKKYPKKQEHKIKKPISKKVAFSRKTELVSLNPDINKWFLLKRNGKTYHLENVSAKNKISISNDNLIVKAGIGFSEQKCSLWNALSAKRIAKYKNPYYPLCNGLVYLRLDRSSTTRLSLTEWATEKIRKVSFGESFINFLKPLIVATHAEAAEDRAVAHQESRKRSGGSLLDAQINALSPVEPVSVENHLGVSIKNNEKFVRYGKWYQTNMHDGIYVSLMIPQIVAPSVLNSFPRKVKTIKNNEMDKLAYFTAYDLSKYSLNFVHGTTYPGLPANTKHKENYKTIGSIPPYKINSAVSVFIGGYKKTHGTFKYGEHQGKTYGFMENGVVLSKMEAGLATIYSTKDGEVHIGKWPKDKNEEAILMKNVVSARQNGVMIIDNYEPGKHINSWGGGNWSGDVNGNLRTLRSTVCMQRTNGKKYLVFGAFTAASPNTMARVLQSYSCEYAMQLDMNAYMYLHNAIFKFDKNNQIDIEYLHTEMEYPKGLKRHRYVMDNNNRDFFYVYKKGE